MKTLRVETERGYDVRIERGLLAKTGELLLTIGKPCFAVVVSDSNVAPLYADCVCASMEAAGFSVARFVFDAGEERKTLETYGALLHFCADCQLTRSDLLVALGGGVTGDLTGFAAATYLRGIRFVQLPTTFLAAVDSSVGGKTGVDLPNGKNLAGAFWQPSLVLCDPDAFATLPADVFADGTAEAIKYGVLTDPALFSQLEKPFADVLEEVIFRCVQIKRDIVSRDEHDRGERMLLNLGHTFGHAVEAHSRYALRHGQAVAIGMVLAAKAAAKHGFCSEACVTRICTVLEANALPARCSDTADALLPHMLHDKKRAGGTISLILPREIGRCEILPMPVEELPALLQDCLS